MALTLFLILNALFPNEKIFGSLREQLSMTLVNESLELINQSHEEFMLGKYVNMYEPLYKVQSRLEAMGHKKSCYTDEICTMVATGQLRSAMKTFELQYDTLIHIRDSLYAATTSTCKGDLQ